MKKVILFTSFIFISILKGWSLDSDDYDKVVNKAKEQLGDKLTSSNAKEYFQTQIGKDTSTIKFFLKDKEPRVVHLVYNDSKNQEYLVIFTDNSEKMGILLNEDLDFKTVGTSSNCQFNYLSQAFKFDDSYLQATFGKIPRYIEVYLFKDYVFNPELIFIREQNINNKAQWNTFKNDKTFDKKKSLSNEVINFQNANINRNRQ